MPHPIRWFDTSTNLPDKLLDLLSTAVLRTSENTNVVAPYHPETADPLPGLRHDTLESYANWSYFAERFPELESALIVTTSGSSGQPKQTLLSSEALTTSAEATTSSLGGHGQWLAALPLHYIAGIQVLVRSLHAGIPPVYLKSVGGTRPFGTQDFLDSAERMDAARRYTSLVPTQLQKLISHLGKAPSSSRGFSRRLHRALQRFDAILLGGSAAPAALLHEAGELGINVVTTYGMTETAGGCVYDGVALPSTDFRIEDGIIVLSGSTLACGYLETSAGSPLTKKAFFEHGRIRLFRTQDVGHLETGRLIVSGRHDDTIVSGGIKLSPLYLSEKYQTLPEVADSFVTAFADPYWGQQVVALIVPATADLDPQRLLYVMKRSGAFKREEQPKRIVFTKKIPHLMSGKVDKRKAISLIRAAISFPTAERPFHPLQ